MAEEEVFERLRAAGVIMAQACRLLRRRLNAWRVRRALRAPFFADFVRVSERKSKAFAIYLQARQSRGADAAWRRRRFRSEHLRGVLYGGDGFLICPDGTAIFREVC